MTIERGLLVALVALIALFAVAKVGTSVRHSFCEVSAAFDPSAAVRCE